MESRKTRSQKTSSGFIKARMGPPRRRKPCEFLRPNGAQSTRQIASKLATRGGQAVIRRFLSPSPSSAQNPSTANKCDLKSLKPRHPRKRTKNARERATEDAAAKLIYLAIPAVLRRQAGAVKNGLLPANQFRYAIPRTVSTNEPAKLAMAP